MLLSVRHCTSYPVSPMNEPTDYLMNMKSNPIHYQELYFPKQKNTTVITKPTKVPKTGGVRKKRNKKVRSALEERLKLNEITYNSPSIDSSSASVDIPFQYGRHINIITFSEEITQKINKCPTSSSSKKNLSQMLYNLR